MNTLVRLWGSLLGMLEKRPVVMVFIGACFVYVSLWEVGENGIQFAQVLLSVSCLNEII